MKMLIGIFITALWFIGWGTLIFLFWPSVKNLGFNELGDFIAGMVAPLALLWVILGYLQQGDELRLNTNALKAQEAELKNQVSEANALVIATTTNTELLRTQIVQEKESEVKVAFNDIDELAFLTSSYVDQWLYDRVAHTDENMDNLNDKFAFNSRRIGVKLRILRDNLGDNYPQGLQDAVTQYQRFGANVLIQGLEKTDLLHEESMTKKRAMFDAIEQFSSI